jgi:hypothetical protein
LLGLNEIRPTAESAEDTLQRRELDIYEGQSTTVKVPYQPEISGSWKTYRDPRAYDAGFDILGIAVHARREGAGIITYDYDMAGGDLDWRDLLPLLRAANQTMREVRDANVAARRADFDAQAPPSKNPAAAYIFGGFVVVGAMFAAPVSAPAALIAGGMALARS